MGRRGRATTPVLAARPLPTPSLTITALSHLGGIASSTLRYYETLGLVVPSGRTRAGYRLYSPSAVDRVRFIRSAQQAGLTLEDIRVVQGTFGSALACDNVQKVLSERLAQIRGRLLEFRKLERALKRALEDCRRGSTADLCRGIC